MEKRTDRDYKAEWERLKNDPELMDAKHAYLREWRAQHLEKERARSRAKYAANKEYYKQKGKAWYDANKDLYREIYEPRRREKRAANPEPDRQRVREWHHRNKDYRKRYDQERREGPRREQILKLMRYGAHKHYLSREKYEEIYPRLLNGPCEICGKEGPMKIDHCHERMVYRGVLCDQCNRGIGFLRDDPKILMNAITYLSRGVAG